jgi:hypothetical protein
MLEERAHQFCIVGDFLKLSGNALFQFLALLQRTARITRALPWPNATSSGFNSAA